MNHAPAFQHYANDFLAETAFLTMEGRGVYITLKSYYWIKNELPNDTRLLARLCALSEAEFTMIWEREVKELFAIDSEKIYHSELISQREFQEEKREKAKASADARWKNANVMRTHKPTECTSTSTPTAKEDSVKEKPLQTAKPVTNKTTLSEPIKKPKGDPVMRRIWDDGVEMLKHGGMKEPNARSLLGKLAKQHTNSKLAEAIAITMAGNPVNPEEFLIATLNAKQNGAKNGSNQNGISKTEQRNNDALKGIEFDRAAVDLLEREGIVQTRRS
jgi:uncharacterized protein YdaU (DUF1376 family)